METGKQILEMERRKERAKDVVVRFVSDTAKNLHFETIKTDSKGYAGWIDKEAGEKPGLDKCDCKNFEFGQKYPEITTDHKKQESLFFAEHGYNFQCKHILAAKDLLKKDEGAIKNLVDAVFGN